MGLDCSLLTKHIMKLFVVLSVVACSYAAPVADADAQVLAYGHGLLGGVYHAGVVPAATVAVAPAADYHVAAPAVAQVKTVEVKAAPAVSVAPVAYHHVAAPAVHVATAPVVHQVGYQVHHQVPQVTVQKHTSTHTTHHVINHAPVVGAFIGALPVAAAAAPAEAAAEAAPVVEEA